MIKPLLGIVLGIMIGVGCCFSGVPLPGLPAILGAILAVAMGADGLWSLAAPALAVAILTGMAARERWAPLRRRPSSAISASVGAPHEALDSAQGAHARMASPAIGPPPV